MIALLGLITALVGGASISVVLAALTLPEWISIAGLLLGAGEEAIKLFVALHPALIVLGEELQAQLHNDAPSHARAEAVAHKAVNLSFVDLSRLPYVPENLI